MSFIFKITILVILYVSIQLSLQQTTSSSCWSNWSSWSTCNDTCGLCGTQTMTRTCNSSCSASQCSGSSSASQQCAGGTVCFYPRTGCCSGAVAAVVNKSFGCVAG